MTKTAILLAAFAAVAPAQTSPLAVVVAMPYTGIETLTLGGSLPGAFTIMMTSDLNPSTRLSVSAALTTGTVSLFDELIKRPAYFVRAHCGDLPSRNCLDLARNAGPDLYPMNGGSGQVASLPAATPIAVTIASPGQDSFRMTTGSFLMGVSQSADQLTISIGGKFDPSVATYVYFGFWPVAVRQNALMVTPNQISINLIADRTTFARPSGWYAVTVVQNSVCGGVMMRYQSPFPNPAEGAASTRIQ